MARFIQLRRLRIVTLGACLAAVVASTGVVRAGGGLAAIDAFHVGRYHLANGDRSQALDSFNDALRMNPQFVQAYIARGKLLAEMGELDSALADLNFALRLQPTHAEGFAYRGFVLLSQGKPEESVPEFEMALRLDPSYARVHYLRGQALRAVGNESGAEASIATALRLDPSIETTQILATKTAADGSIGVQLNAPAGLERASQMADTTAPPPASLPRGQQGRVIRYDQHPQLANLQLPFAPTSVAPSVAVPKPSRPPVHPKTNSVAEEIQTAHQPGPNKVSSSPAIPRDLGSAPLAQVEDLPAPSAAEILNGAALGDALPPKPTPEASRDRIAAAVASAQQSVVEVPPVLVGDGPAAADSQPKSTPPVAVASVSDPQSPLAPLPPASAVGDAEKSRDDAELCRNRGVEREEQGDPSAAMREYDNAIRLDPSDPQTYCLRGRLYLKAQLTTEAAADFERAIQLAPGLAIGYFGRAHARYLQNEFADAIDDYTIVLRLDDCHAQALMERGHCYAQLGEAEKAELDRRAAVALDPSLAKTGPKYGSAVPKAPTPSDVSTPAESPAVYIGDAPEKIEPTSAIEPVSASAFGDLFSGAGPTKQPQPLPVEAPNVAPIAGTATVSDQTEPALISDETPSPVEPTTPTVVPPTAAELAELLPSASAESSEDGAARQEVQHLTDELSRSPGDAKLYFRRAGAQLRLGNPADAVDDLNAALRIDPNSNEALALRAQAHEEAQRLPAALTDLNELLRRNPNDGARLAQRGGVKLALGLVEEAVADLTAALTNNHDSAEAYCRRGLAWAVLGDSQRAMNDFAAALQRDPQNAEIYVCRGRAYVEFQRPTEALADFNRAVELDPQCADAYFERSRLYAARGAYEKSQSDRRRALTLDPTLR